MKEILKILFTTEYFKNYFKAKSKYYITDFYTKTRYVSAWKGIHS